MTREIQTIANIGSGTMGHATAHCGPDLRFAVRRNGMEARRVGYKRSARRRRTNENRIAAGESRFGGCA